MKKFSDAASLMLLLMVLICALVVAALGSRAVLKEKEAVMLTKAVVTAGSVSDAFYDLDPVCLNDENSSYDAVLSVLTEDAALLSYGDNESGRNMPVRIDKDLDLCLEFSRAADIAVMNLTFTHNGDFVYSLHCERYAGGGLK